MPIYNSIEELIGFTPLLRLNRYAPGLDVLAKLERQQNPAGSAKDRAALYMIRDAEERGALAPGGMIIEPTSGNTGIGIAALAAVLGYRAVIVMPDSMSAERVKLIARLRRRGRADARGQGHERGRGEGGGAARRQSRQRDSRAV